MGDERDTGFGAFRVLCTLQVGHPRVRRSSSSRLTARAPFDSSTYAEKRKRCVGRGGIEPPTLALRVPCSA